MKINDILCYLGLIIMFVSVSFVGGDTKPELIISVIPYMFGLGIHISSYVQLNKTGGKKHGKPRRNTEQESRR